MHEKFTGWHILFLQYLKRDWKKLIIWVLSIVLFSASFVPAFKEIAQGKGLLGMRSEERRVGKECRSRWSPYH